MMENWWLVPDHGSRRHVNRRRLRFPALGPCARLRCCEGVLEAGYHVSAWDGEVGQGDGRESPKGVFRGAFGVDETICVDDCEERGKEADEDERAREAMERKGFVGFEGSIGIGIRGGIGG